MDRCYAYGRYRRARNDAWDCLVDCRVKSLPVPVFSIAAALNVQVSAYGSCAGVLRQKGYAPLLEAAGFACVSEEGKLIIFFNDRNDIRQTRFTIAHELGHIVLGHMGETLSPDQLLLPSDPQLEKEADRFALRLLAPACALWAMGAYSPKAIAALCDIPLEKAEIRARRMRELRGRNKWLSSWKERKLFQQMGLSRPDL